MKGKAASGRPFSFQGQPPAGLSGMQLPAEAGALVTTTPTEHALNSAQKQRTRIFIGVGAG